MRIGQSAVEVKTLADFSVHVQEPDNGLTQTSDIEALQAPIVRVERVVVDACPVPVSFIVPPGAAVMLLDSAARPGSVILRLVARASPPRSGRLEVLGRDAAGLSGGDRATLRRRLGSVPRDLALDADLSAFDTVALAAVAAGRSPRDYAAEALELLSWVGLGRRIDDRAGDFDEAGSRRLALARALINRPEALIADDLAGALVGDDRRGLLRLVAELQAAGTAVLMTSRDEALADRSGAQVVRLSAPPGDEALAGAA
jgi:cell division transport system ATP-binding protein